MDKMIKLLMLYTQYIFIQSASQQTKIGNKIYCPKANICDKDIEYEHTNL